MNDLRPSSDAIEIALEKVLSSASFRGRPQLRRLLTHLVQYSFAENGDPMKEYTLGVEVFDRGIRFDPQCDSIVRVEAFNLRRALRAYYGSEGATDLVTIGVPKGGYRATFRLNEEPPAAILDDPERLCCQVEWSLLRGSAHDIARSQRHVQHAIVRWPGRSDLHVALASTALAALELESVSPADKIGVMRQAAHTALQCDPTRGDAEFYATIHRIMGARKDASIAAAYRWLDFAPKSALAHFWVGRYGWPRPAEWATLSSTYRRPPGSNRTRPALKPGSPLGCSARVVPTPDCDTSEQSWRSSQMTILRTSGSVCSHRTRAGSTKRGMRPAARISCLAVRKRSPRWGTSRRHRDLSSQPKPSWTPLRIPTTDTSRDQVSARFTSRWDVSIARLESGALLTQTEIGN